MHSETNKRDDYDDYDDRDDRDYDRRDQCGGGGRDMRSLAKKQG